MLIDHETFYKVFEDRQELSKGSVQSKSQRTVITGSISAPLSLHDTSLVAHHKTHFCLPFYSE